MIRSLGALVLLALAACGSAPPARPLAPPAKPPAPPQDPKPAAWEVDAPPGPHEDVALDVDEGTWMSLDLSPDGREIVFDLLGDLYSIPAAGGDAKALTSGVAWDMQPRFSPDGSHIAFTSDRGGGDNLWIMNRDGSEPRAVTKESFRLFNSPAWTPDGEFLAGRKHFTSRRSLGAGEIWLIHRAGGDGVPMTKKANEQKDLGEPAFSPDGRFLYFSLDATPGDTFEYNKDSNKGIYAIRRLDRETGEIEEVAGGPGGACRPTPSPDGKSLAFVRRVRFRSVLVVRDLESGAERVVVEALERDMQETWAVHGVYPTMAWTPDSKGIIFWAGGKIRRVDVASRVVDEIPFRVKSSRRVTPALRFPVKAAPEAFDVRMLRWVNVSPKGDRVVYSALGHIYVRALPDGEPRRLTSQSEHFEYYPGFSRDGESVVYVSWSDDALGAVRVAPAAGGEGRAVTKQPGHYVEPAMFGKTVVYRKIGGGGIVSPLWSASPGIYAVTDGEPVRIAKEGVRPHFGARPDRVYLLRHAGEKRQLVSVSAGGGDERVHLVSENATEFRVSPDERRVAFTERFNAYVIPFARSGREVEVGPKMTALPIRRVSLDAGEYLHWSGDSARLHWSLGPELFTRAVDDASPPAGKGVNISFSAKADVPEGRVALVGARIVTMRGDEVVAKGNVVVERNRIVAVGDVPVPSGAAVIDVAGCTIVPGFVDVHAHGPQGHEEIIPQRNWAHYAGLAFGVTTVHDPSHDTSMIFASSEMGRAGLITAPRIFSTGTILYGAAGDFKAEIDSLEDARSHLRRMKAVGAFSVKSYNQPRRDQRQQVIAAARELGMMVVPEGGSLFQHNMTMVVDGHTGIEHSIPVARVYADVVQLWSRTQVQYTPTLGVGYGGIFGENYWYHHTEVWKNERLLRFVPREAVDARSRRVVMAPEEEYNHVSNAQACKRLSDAGVRVNLGAHGQREGLAAHWELWMLAQGGMTPLECLRAATIHGARYVGLDGDLGTVEAGKLADLVVIEKDVLADIRASEHVRYVMANGRLFDARTMDEVAPRRRARGRLWWERR